MRKLILSGKTGLLEFDFWDGFLASFIVNDVTKRFDNKSTVADITGIKGYKVVYDSDKNTYENLMSVLRGQND